MRKLYLSLIFTFLFVNISFAKLSVNTSIFILSTIVKQIGKDKVDVSYVIPPSANPHLFSPRPKDLANFRNADIFIGIGYGFEFWFNRIAYLRKGKRNLFLSSFYKHPIDMVMVDKDVIANPHIWLDMRFMIKTGIPEITQAMCDLDKGNCSFFENNETNLLKNLRIIEIDYEDLVKKMKKLCIVDVKPAFEYFFRSIGKPTCGVVVKRGNEMPKVSDIKFVIEHCRCRKGIVIYLDNPYTAKSIADILKYKPVKLNPLGDPTKQDENTYVNLLKYNLMLLKRFVK